MQSTNEELQAANEELEAAKEEQQSLNEETITVNSELNARIKQLTRLENDMKNLLDCIATGTLFLDRRLVIQRYTPAAVKVYRLIAGDVGRPLSDITSNLAGADASTRLQADFQAVLDTLIPIEREVRCSDGAWYLARIQPYRTLDNVIQGVALTFTPVTAIVLFEQHAAALRAALGEPGERLGHEIRQFAFEAARETLQTLRSLESHEVQLIPGSSPGQAIPANAGIQSAAELDTGVRRYDVSKVCVLCTGKSALDIPEPDVPELRQLAGAMCDWGAGVGMGVNSAASDPIPLLASPLKAEELGKLALMPLAARAAANPGCRSRAC